MNKADLILHPVRLRILQALLGDQELTTTELSERLQDVSKATVYRHVAVMAEAGLLEVVSERPVRGVVERTYRLHRDRAAMSDEAIAAMTIEDHRRGFEAVLAALLAEFTGYLDRDGADPLADSASYRQFALWLTDEERAEFIAEVRAVIVARTHNVQTPERRKHLLTTIMFPTT